MASTKLCPFCGAAVRSDEKVCPGCGSANEGYVEDAVRTIYKPKTIEELKEYCAERGMPLQKMRFFIGENYQQPKAFGIYQDKGRFIVYKNKANGQRAIRYQGPDEAHAVNELFAKMLDECHLRGIYPDGKPQQLSGSSPSAGSYVRSQADQGSSQADFFHYSDGSFDWGAIRKILIFAAVILFIGMMLSSLFSHSKDGYYRDSRSKLYYRYGSDWYEYSSTFYSSREDWRKTGSFPAENADDYYLGKEYYSGWGESNFKSSSVWDSIQESNSSSSSDYDSWDSSDTDWDSDW